MTKQRLKQLFWLKKEIIQLERRISEIRHAIGMQSPKTDGMPRSGAISIVEQAACILVDLCEKLETKKFLLARELEELEYFLNSVKDSVVRQIFRLRYIDLKSWWQISFEVGGGNTADSVRKIHDRALFFY
jgi:hypothetical protein